MEMDVVVDEVLAEEAEEVREKDEGGVAVSFSVGAIQIMGHLFMERVEDCRDSCAVESGP